MARENLSENYIKIKPQDFRAAIEKLGRNKAAGVDDLPDSVFHKIKYLK
jgi:hypothetical protein